MASSRLEKTIQQQAQRASQAALLLARIPTKEKNIALRKMAKALLENETYLIKENAKDLQKARDSKYPSAFIDRLTLTPKRIYEMAKCLQDVARLKDPIGEVIRVIRRPNGLVIHKVRTPIGVIGIIYESRPNVTSDCIGLTLKSGNAVILKGGKESIYSNRAIYRVLLKSIKKTKIPSDAIQLIDTTQRDAVKILLRLNNTIDLIIPRGGEGLIRFVVENSFIPVIKHYKGVCHIFVSDKANIDKALKVCFNAKVQRPSVCNAMETLLVHRKIANRFLPRMAKQFQEAGVVLRCCPRTRQVLRGFKVEKATNQDWYEEYNDLILSVKIVDNLEGAINHINTYGSKHSDGIMTENRGEADRFAQAVDSACVFINASTRFSDGYQFGLGAEIGISTDKLHARGPMGLEELTSYKYVVKGKGQIRT